MDASSIAVQLLNGLAQASTLFLVAAGLSLIFGVTKIVNFAHGSFYMLGLYVAYALTEGLGRTWGLGWSYWPLVLLTGVIVGLLGAVLEVLFLRRIYKSPEIYQLLCTFALVLIFKDACLWFWGAEDLLGPRAPGLTGAVEILGRRGPSYDLFLILMGPLVLGLLWWMLKRTRLGLLIRAASQDREMVGALGVEQRKLFTVVFALGCALAGWAGALQLPREPANLNLDMLTIGEAFVVVVVGGLGSLPGAFAAAVLIAEIKAICIAIGTVEMAGLSFVFSKLTLVAEFLVMALVLIFKPWGLMGSADAQAREPTRTETPLAPLAPLSPLATGGIGTSPPRWVWWAGLVFLFFLPSMTPGAAYSTILAIDLLTATLFAMSLYFLMGPAGMLSFGQAAFFGLGAYASGWMVIQLHLPMAWALVLAPLIAALFAATMGWFCVRLSGVYLAMLTLAFAQILWSICFQWESLTGGSNGLTGIWPSELFSEKSHYYDLTLALVVGACWILSRIIDSPFGFALRSARDSSLRAQAIGMNVQTLQWTAFAVSGYFAGLAGALFAFSKGSISPDSLGISKSVDALVMVLFGGLHTLSGPILGAVSFTWLQDTIVRETQYWRACFGAVILLLVLVFPNGLMGLFSKLGWGGMSEPPLKNDA
jgi:branched-chain amino acid transport system permease protein